MIREILIADLYGKIHFSHYFAPLPPNEQGTINKEIVETCLERSGSSPAFQQIHHCRFQEWYVYFQRSGVFIFIALVDPKQNSIIEQFLASFTDIVVHVAKISTEKKLQHEASKVHNILAKMVSHGGRVLELRPSHVLPPSGQPESASMNDVN